MVVKLGRNAPCPCGSGKKYKKCCLDQHRQEESERLKGHAAALEQDLDAVRDWLPTRDLADAEEALPDWPINPARNHLWDHLQDGRMYAAEDRPEDALREWWMAWEEIRLLLPEGADAVEALDRELGIAWPVSDLVYEIERILGQAGRGESRRLERRIEFCEEVLERFPSSHPHFALNLRCGIAESLFGLGRVDEGEQEFRSLAEAQPDESWIYIEWGGVYALNRMNDAIPEDLDRAEELYRAGLARTSTDRAELRFHLRAVQRERLGPERPAQPYLEDEDIHLLVSEGAHVKAGLW